MRVVLATDHAGFDLKEVLKKYLLEHKFEVEDMGAMTYDEHDDYPDTIAPAARAVSADPENTRGIILGGSGQGEAIVANRFPNVRAIVYNGESRGSLYNSLDEIQLSREHNDANILSLGARFLTEEEAQVAVQRWLETPFSGDERHVRRIRKIEELKENI